MNIHDCYEVLGLEGNASIEDIRKAYKSMVKSWHPDQFSNDPELKQKADEKLKHINVAYTTLTAFLKSKQTDGPELQNWTEIRNGFTPFRKSEPDGHFIKRMFSFFSNLLDRIFDPAEIEKRVRQAAEAGKPDERKSGCQSRHINSEGRFNQQKFSSILKDKLNSDDDYDSSKGFGSPSTGGTGKRAAGMSQWKHRYAQHRVHDTGPVSRISPVSRIKGIGRNR